MIDFTDVCLVTRSASRILMTKGVNKKVLVTQGDANRENDLLGFRPVVKRKSKVPHKKDVARVTKVFAKAVHKDFLLVGVKQIITNHLTDLFGKVGTETIKRHECLIVLDPCCLWNGWTQCLCFQTRWYQR